MKYLRCLEFVRWGGETGSDTRFVLADVLEEWPEASVPVRYPSATIVDAGSFEMEAHNFEPTPLEETFGVFGENTMLWKLAEGVTTFQVDFWADDNATREAIAARLPGAFAPGEQGYRVVLEGSPLYFDRRVRAELLRYRRADSVNAAFVRERRLFAEVRCEVDVVDLRCVQPLLPRVRVPEIGPDVDVTTQDIDPESEAL